MSRKILLLVATAVAALAAMALPAIAAATTPEIDFTREPTTTNPLNATGTTGVTRLVSKGGSEVVCQSSHVTITWTSKTTGHIHVTFTECSSSGFACTGSGLPTGDITVGEFLFHLTYIKPFGKTTPGVLITAPESGVFTEFNCTFLVHVKVTGNGVLGHIDTPACGGKSASSTVSFEQGANRGEQKYQEDEGLAGKWHLESSFNGGAAEESAQIGSGTTTLVEGNEGTLTCP